MKNYTAILGCLFLMNGLGISCGTTKKETAAAPMEVTGKKWLLTELHGKAVSSEVNGKMPFVELHKNDTTFAASGGCNGLGGTYHLLTDQKIKFKLGMQTLMACEDMWIENELKQALTESQSYVETKDSLWLKNIDQRVVARFTHR